MGGRGAARADAKLGRRAEAGRRWLQGAALLATGLLVGAPAAFAVGSTAVALRVACRRADALVAHASETELQKFRDDLAKARERQAVIEFRMSTAEREEQRLYSRLTALRGEREQVVAQLEEMEQRVASLHAETDAKLEQVRLQAEQERLQAVAAVLAQQSEGRDTVEAALHEVETKAEEARSLPWHRRLASWARSLPLLGRVFGASRPAAHP